jgi:hypothetical protein
MNIPYMDIFGFEGIFSKYGYKDKAMKVAIFGCRRLTSLTRHCTEYEYSSGDPTRQDLQI